MFEKEHSLGVSAATTQDLILRRRVIGYTFPGLKSVAELHINDSDSNMTRFLYYQVALYIFDMQSGLKLHCSHNMVTCAALSVVWLKGECSEHL